MNPFQKHDVSDFPDVYVPLARATRNASVVATHDKRLRTSSDDPVDGKTDEAIVGGEHNTVEGLRAEIDDGTLEKRLSIRTIVDLSIQILRLLVITPPMTVRDVLFFAMPQILPARPDEPLERPPKAITQYLIRSRKVQSHQQGNPRYWHGSLCMYFQWPIFLFAELEIYLGTICS